MLAARGRGYRNSTMAIETSPSADQLRGGKPSAKLVPVGHLEGLLSDGAGFAGFAAGDIGQGPHDPDIAAMPDTSTLTHLPWKPEVARFARRMLHFRDGRLE